MSEKFKYICISAPSGTGKSTVIKVLLKKIPELALSISATSREPRGTEKDGVEYIFLSADEFEDRIRNNELLEYEKVHGNYYGTLFSSVAEFIEKGNSIVFDIDVNGALLIKSRYGEEALTIFLKAPNEGELVKRLMNRKTESEEKIKKRLERLPYELKKSEEFDLVIINDKLEETVKEIRNHINQEL